MRLRSLLLSVAEDVFIWSVHGTKAQCEPRPLNCALEILLLTYHIYNYFGAVG